MRFEALKTFKRSYDGISVKEYKKNFEYVEDDVHVESMIRAGQAKKIESPVIVSKKEDFVKETKSEEEKPVIKKTRRKVKR